MRLAVTSDLHGHLPSPDSFGTPDLILITGDLGPPAPGYLDAGPHAEAFLTDELAPWLATLPARAVGIGGNHDLIAQANPALMRSLPWTWLENESKTVAGLRLYGSPVTPRTPIYDGWAFLKNPNELHAHYAAIPDDTDIVLTHGPPAGILDGGFGCPHLAARVREVAPQLHVFGHVHTHHGSFQADDHRTRYVNTAHVDEGYQPKNPPVEIDF